MHGVCCCSCGRKDVLSVWERLTWDKPRCKGGLHIQGLNVSTLQLRDTTSSFGEPIRKVLVGDFPGIVLPNSGGLITQTEICGLITQTVVCGLITQTAVCGLVTESVSSLWAYYTDSSLGAYHTDSTVCGLITQPVVYGLITQAVSSLWAFHTHSNLWVY